MSLGSIRGTAEDLMFRPCPPHPEINDPFGSMLPRPASPVVMGKLRNCAIRGKTCRYRQSDDKRKVPVRPAVAVLARRVDSLVHHIRECGLPVPPIDEEDHRILKNVLDALELRCEDVVADPNDTSSRTGQANILPTTPVSVNSSAPPTQPNETDSVGPSHQPSVCLEPLDLSFDKERVAWKDSTISEAPREEEEEVGDSDDEVTDQLSCRLGRLQVTHDGQLRYFGSTSNLTLLDALVDVTPPVAIPRDAPELLENAKLNQEVDEAFEKHLIDLFFAWQDPSLHVIDAESFWRSRAQSPLSDAMCALGAAYGPKYHPDFVTFPRSLAEFFGDRAKLLVELELDNPSIATIQALVILSNHEASCTRDTRGWLYSGMAMRLTLDLGLHLEMGPYVEKGIIPHQDAEVRRMVFWGVYLNEQFWGFYLGRSAQCRMDAVTVRKPVSPSPVPTSSWKPYPDHLGTSFPQIPFNPLCQEWVSLYEIMLPLTDVLANGYLPRYGCSEISTHSLQELASVTVEKLQQWHLNLPAELKADEGTTVRSPLPHVLTLHMQYYQFMIHCHKPYISRRHIQPQPPQGPGSGHARRMCIESAVAIVQLLDLYEKSYGFDKSSIQMVSFVFSAALILIFNTIPAKTTSQDQHLVIHLSTCFRALDRMASCFENARRTSVFLGTLRQQWQVCRQKRRARAGRVNFAYSRKLDLSESAGWNRDGSEAYSSVQCQPAVTESSVTGLDTELSDLVPYYSAIADAPASTVDFMGPNLCNILLSEGIPRAFV
ncbi:fungal-specific transcription factor domain-domain-containing protein [Aspergillus welwitschiae]|uniref:Fungal-specific transcription factor domain-domain-containing protein n=1 Tax=Aspergillus welwitschiae TaxID=1341132 RepID=A0A3F3PPZ6_9EURO|nr:fungal-specific transcription factor domain-domain-containing protein [Aspergillus welwitschiae]RDH29020.1 fungal-specific transcription factor domain-domain-containing protein [Aspergillus welwitschiae]